MSRRTNGDLAKSASTRRGPEHFEFSVAVARLVQTCRLRFGIACLAGMVWPQRSGLHAVFIAVQNGLKQRPESRLSATSGKAGGLREVERPKAAGPFGR